MSKPMFVVLDDCAVDLMQMEYFKPEDERSYCYLLRTKTGLEIEIYESNNKEAIVKIKQFINDNLVVRSML